MMGTGVVSSAHRQAPVLPHARVHAGVRLWLCVGVGVGVGVCVYVFVCWCVCV